MPEFVAYDAARREAQCVERLPFGVCGTCFRPVVMERRQVFRIGRRMHVGVFCPSCGEFVGIKLAVPLWRRSVCATRAEAEAVAHGAGAEGDECPGDGATVYVVERFSQPMRDYVKFMLEASSLVVDGRLCQGVSMDSRGCRIDDTPERARALAAWLQPPLGAQCDGGSDAGTQDALG